MGRAGLRPLERWYEHRTGGIYLTDSTNAYAGSRAVYGQVIQGRWYDTGNPATTPPRVAPAAAGEEESPSSWSLSCRFAAG